VLNFALNLEYLEANLYPDICLISSSGGRTRLAAGRVSERGIFDVANSVFGAGQGSGSSDAGLSRFGRSRYKSQGRRDGCTLYHALATLLFVL
jgi:hypothetical protein